MKMRIVYVLISRSSDYYTEQMMLSIYSLMKFNPDVEITIVCDVETQELLSGNDFISSNPLITVHTEEFEEQIELKTRSRFLKTSLREIIHGDFLFIDTDTVICGPLSDLYNMPYNLAMVYDCNQTKMVDFSDAAIVDRCRKINPSINVIGTPYYNSGVILARDTKAVHDFYALWHNNWKISLADGLNLDQPALCVTNNQTQFKIARLDDSWNCQCKYKASVKDARIIHYFNPSADVQYTESPLAFLLYDEIRGKGFKSEYINKLIVNQPETLCVLLQIKKDAFGRYCSSPLIDVFFKNRRLFRLLETTARRIMRFIYDR